MYDGQLPLRKASRAARAFARSAFYSSYLPQFESRDSRDEVGDLDTELAGDASGEKGSEESTKS